MCISLPLVPAGFNTPCDKASGSNHDPDAFLFIDEATCAGQVCCFHRSLCQSPAAPVTPTCLTDCQATGDLTPLHTLSTVLSPVTATAYPSRIGTPTDRQVVTLAGCWLQVLRKRHQLADKEVARLYRILHIYSLGFHQVVVEVTLHAAQRQPLLLAIWKAFSQLWQDALQVSFAPSPPPPQLPLACRVSLPSACPMLPPVPSILTRCTRLSTGLQACVTG